MKLVDVTTGLVVWSINRSVASYASNNMSGTIGGITLVGMRGSVYRIDVLITIANDEDCSASATASIAAGQILSGAVVNTISEIGFDGFNFINSANDFLNYGLDGFFRRGATDIPSGLGGASISYGGTVSRVWGKIGLTSRVVKSGSNYTITHNIGDSNYSLILTPISTSVPYFSSKAANTIVVTCAGGFDFILIRTQ
jgi:hypothetical protein